MFAFGVLLHELLTGVHPFKRSSPLEMAHAILNEVAPPLEETGAPPRLAHIVSRCLEKDPKTRAAVLTDQVQARNKDAVLAALGELATRMRRSLGESLAGLSAQVKPLPMVTTSSIEALKLYAEGLKVDPYDSAGNAMLRQAVALDPDFALAYAELGRRPYLESGRQAREEGEQLFAKALRLTDRLTLRERLWIQVVAEDSRGNRVQAADAYKGYLAVPG